jgi:hypothetical protein
MRITCLHTADVHVATFDSLFHDQGADVQLSHVVRADLLSQAQTNGLETVADAFEAVMTSLPAADVVLCTCSTLGPLVDALDGPQYLRIDRPVMKAAARLGENPLLAICLESTREASLGLLMACRADLRPTVVHCKTAWAHFQQGNQQAFAKDIAETIRAAYKDESCVILAQASMRVAAPLLIDLQVPILSTPQLAVIEAIAMAQS